MKQFKVEDLLFGFHFSFQFISPLSPVRKPLIASLQIENEMEENFSCYGKEYIFSVSCERNAFEVNAQLPWDMNFDSTSTLSVRISDRYDNAVLEVQIHQFWLERQKEKLLNGCQVDILKCGIHNPVQMEKICVEEERHSSLFWIRRLGRKVGNGTCVALMQDNDYKSIMLHREFDKFRNWMLQYTSLLGAGFIAGHHFLPLYSILCLADARDEWSFSHQGWIQTKLPHKTWIQSWSKEWNDTVKFTNTTENQFWKVVDLMCCNTSSTMKDVINKKKFSFPRFNSCIRNQVDVICSRMLVIDMLYRLQKSLTSELANKWPCIAVALNEENDLILLCGLLGKTLLNSIVLDGRLKSKTLLHLQPQIIGTVKLVMMCWRDYREDVMCTTLFRDEFTKEVGVECFPHEKESAIETCNRDGKSELYVTKYKAVAPIFSHAFNMNGPRALRPIVNVNNLLLDKHLMSKKHIAWHLGYVTETRCCWTRDHVVSSFDASRSISFAQLRQS